MHKGSVSVRNSEWFDQTVHKVVLPDIAFRFDQKLFLFLDRKHTVKPAFSSHSKRRPKLVFKTEYRLMQVKSIAECSKGSILQYFRPSLGYHLSFRPW